MASEGGDMRICVPRVFRILTVPGTPYWDYRVLVDSEDGSIQSCDLTR